MCTNCQHCALLIVLLGLIRKIMMSTRCIYDLKPNSYKKSWIELLKIIWFLGDSALGFHLEIIQVKNFYILWPESNKKRAENLMLSFDKSKESAVFSIILRRFLFIFSTPTFISFTKLKIRRCWTGLNHNWFKSYDTKCNAGQKE